MKHLLEIFLIMREFKIGRLASNDIVINEPTVSKYHAVLRIDQTGVTLTDLNSTNGSFVNGNRVYGSTRLNGLDIVKLGMFLLDWNNYVVVDMKQDVNFINDSYSDQSVTPSKSFYNQEILRIERSIRDRNDSDKILVNFWLYFFMLSWITFGIMRIILFFQIIGRIDRFIVRKKAYYEGLIKFCEHVSKDLGKYEELSMNINRLRDVYEYEFLMKNRSINAGLSFFLVLITFGIWNLVVRYKTNKAWENLQLSEQKFYDELNPIFTKLGLTKYPIDYRIKSKSRNYFLYLFLSIITLGIWTIVWNYNIHTDPEDLYSEFHVAEDSVLASIKR